MKTIRYKGSVGAYAKNIEFGLQWSAPGIPEDASAKNQRELDDAVADALLASGCFEQVTQTPPPNKRAQSPASE